ncbi:MAG: putative transporter [Bacteroidales bacterium]|jgi:putative transport protein|nr:putative transporter [Bacteroidales bacterium]MCI2132850.1 putative transporter [Bacteroidales bacterium]
MADLFLGTGIAHTLLLFAVVIMSGLWLGRYKVKGVSLGTTWILFVGILLSHFGFKSDPTVLSFMKDFGLILFVFSIGLQVGPGFFSSFKKGGVQMNLLAVLLVLLAVGVTVAIQAITKEDLPTMVGVMSGAVTNTPGLGAAQQTVSDISGAEAGTPIAGTMASAYAVAYPIGVLGVIFLLIFAKGIFKIDLDKEKKSLEQDDEATEEKARRMHCEVTNPAIFGKSLSEVTSNFNKNFVVSRMMRNGEIFVPKRDTVLQQGDKLLLVTKESEVESLRIVFGSEIPMHQSDWMKMDEHLITRRISVTKQSLTGKKLKSLMIRSNFNVSVTRIIRAGIELVANGNLLLQFGDVLQVVGTEDDINAVAKLVGNRPESLSHPNLVPFFFGIALGIILGMIPITFPGIPQPIKLGLAGGTLIIAILLGYFGPRLRITTYTTMSANMMLRELGISFFLAAVGLGAGDNFVSSIVNGGYWWILYGALITLIPIALIIFISKVFFKLNFYKICGLVSGGTTDPAVLAFAQDAYGTDYTSVNYATVYPLTMFMRVLVAQLMIMLAL